MVALILLVCTGTRGRAETETQSRAVCGVTYSKKSKYLNQKLVSNLNILNYPLRSKLPPTLRYTFVIMRKGIRRCLDGKVSLGSDFDTVLAEADAVYRGYSYP
jgi:hypothetical protein